MYSVCAEFQPSDNIYVINNPYVGVQYGRALYVSVKCIIYHSVPGKCPGYNSIDPYSHVCVASTQAKSAHQKVFASKDTFHP